MRDGALAAALLCFAFGLLLAYAPRKLRLAALSVTIVVAVVVAVIGPPAEWQDAAFLGCWISIAVTSLIILVSRPVSALPLMALATNTAVWAACVVSADGVARGLVIALPALLVWLPATLLLETRGRVAVKVVASWLAAVAIMAGTLPMATTASFEPDHMS